MEWTPADVTHVLESLDSLVEVLHLIAQSAIIWFGWAYMGSFMHDTAMRIDGGVSR
jgi:hypothetical protein